SRMKRMYSEWYDRLNNKGIFLENCTWQEQAREGVTHKGKLIFWDPWYNLSGVPKSKEDVKAMKEMLAACASAGTTLIIFTKLLLAHLWVELLESCTQPRWWVDPNPLCVIRHPSRARGGYKN